MSLEIISAKYASINELLSLNPSTKILLLKLLVLFIPKDQLTVFFPLLFIPTKPKLFADNLAFESVVKLLFSSDFVNVVFIEGVNVNVGFLNRPNPAGFIANDEKSCPTAPMALPIAMLFAVP